MRYEVKDVKEASLQLTVVVEEQHKEFCPTLPSDTAVRLSKQFSGMYQGSLFVEEVHVLTEAVSDM